MNTYVRLSGLALLLVVTACGGGGGGGGGGTTTPPPIQPPGLPDSTPSPTQSGLLAACAGAGVVRLDWRLPGVGFEAALFQGASRASVYGGAPVVDGATGTSIVLTGQVDGVDTFFGFAIRAAGSSAWTPAGAVLRVRPGAPLYVDGAADQAVANGQTPATAFPRLQDALLIAGSQGGRNVWVRAGSFAEGPYPLGPDTHCAGGFDASFDLATRDAFAGTTMLTGSTGQEIVTVLSGGADASLDGLVVDGGGAVLKGVDVIDGDVELRSVEVRRCADRGVKAVVTVATQERFLLLANCALVGNTSDGLSTAGPYEIVLDMCRLDANGGEGADIDNLDARDGGTSSLRVTGCRFFGNSLEGLDVDLSALAGLPTSATGAFRVHVENCDFELNGLDGLLIDQEHEFFPGFSADIAVLGCSARANRAAGVHVDADANGSYRLERLRCTANATDGVLVTSETNAGEVFVVSSWLAGNLGAGARLASGNKAIVCSHCAFAGNQAGGLLSDSVGCAAANSVFLMQANQLQGAVSVGAFVGDGSAVVFENAPTAFAAVSSAVDGTLSVGGTTGFDVGTSVRVGDDATRRLVASVGVGVLVLDAPPQAFVAPGMVQAYAADDVDDDLRLAVGSPAREVGITAPGVTAPDAGPFGANAGGAPGEADPFAAATLQPVGASPALATGVPALQPIDLVFDRDVAPASLAGERVVVLANGVAVAATVQVVGERINLAPPVGGWPLGAVVEVRNGIEGVDGSALSAPLVLPLRIL